MTVNNLLDGDQITIEQLPITEDVPSEKQIWIALSGHHVVEQDTVLQWRQGVDVLNVGHSTGNLVDDTINVALGEIDKRKEIWSDLGGSGGNEIGWRLRR